MTEAPLADRQPQPAPDTVASLHGVSLHYGAKTALHQVDADIRRGVITGVIGPDGVGKSSLLALAAGARKVQAGRVTVLEGDMADPAHRRQVCPRIAYMPQGLGKNLYPTLTVFENLDFFGRLFGQGRAERRRRMDELVQATGLAPFIRRPVGKLSGGMKQKLGLCCALIHDPDLLILDEPTTGVDPLSRRQFWQLIDSIRHDRPDISILVATAYMEEAAAFDWLLAMDNGRILTTDTPAGLLRGSGEQTLEDAFITMLPEDRRQGYTAVDISPFQEGETGEVAIEARDLTMRFGDFTAVDGASFRIRRGEIFGFLGSNGCGKTTTMKMLTGLLPPSQGKAWLFGQEINPRDLATRHRVGYMSQSFSLYSELSVRQNLVLHAQLFKVPRGDITSRVAQMLDRFGLQDYADRLPDGLPLGHRQRLSLAVAMIHRPELLILDEPTSGVDPIARDDFWRILVDLSRAERVTIFISTHFMNEAERCDRISMMHAGKVLATGSPGELIEAHRAETLEEAFVACLQGATREDVAEWSPDAARKVATPQKPGDGNGWRRFFDPRRMASYAHRESLELIRDPVRLTLALLGSAILLFVMGYGISMDVEDLSFAVLDRDQTPLSRDYQLSIAGSRYFVEGPPIRDYADLDRRMVKGDISLALEIPPGFARDLSRGRPVEIGAWVDGAMPTRAETVVGYVQGIHQHWLAHRANEAGHGAALVPAANIEVRFRYNPDVKSLVAMVPAMIPLLLLMIPAMLATLSVVREKELGSITNFYVTPTRPLEFLMGKQLPYVALSLASFLLLAFLAVTVFQVPLTGSFLALLVAAILYVTAATAMGLLISSFMTSQVAAIFGTAVLTMLPAVSFSGLLDPVSSLEGAGRVIGELYPTTHFLVIVRGAFSKALGLADLAPSFVPLLVAVPVLISTAALLLKKQEG